MKSKDLQPIEIPMDVYQSATEILLLLPLGGVEKSSLHITLKGNDISIRGKRAMPMLKEQYVTMMEQCFWGDFEKHYSLPHNVYLDKIYSELSPENILHIVIPKVIAPEMVAINIL